MAEFNLTDVANQIGKMGNYDLVRLKKEKLSIKTSSSLIRKANYKA
jgi:hypothetical protein